MAEETGLGGAALAWHGGGRAFTSTDAIFLDLDGGGGDEGGGGEGGDEGGGGSTGSTGSAGSGSGEGLGAASGAEGGGSGGKSRVRFHYVISQLFAETVAPPEGPPGAGGGEGSEGSKGSEGSEGSEAQTQGWAPVASSAPVAKAMEPPVSTTIAYATAAAAPAAATPWNRPPILTPGDDALDAKWWSMEEVARGTAAGEVTANCHAVLLRAEALHGAGLL